MAPVDVPPALYTEGVVLERAPYPDPARKEYSQGDCVVTVRVDEAGAILSTEVGACPVLLVDAARTAAMSSSFPAAAAEGGVLTRSYELTWRFRLDPGFGHDWVLSVLGDAYGWCGHCKDGGLLNEDAVQLGFGTSSTGTVWTATVGTRAGGSDGDGGRAGLDLGAAVTRRVFWQSAFTPALALRSSLVVGQADLPLYHSFRPMAGFVLQTMHPDRHGLGWSVELLGGVDVRFGWKYYRELRPDVGLVLHWHLPPPGATAALRAGNTPRWDDVLLDWVPEPAVRPPDTGPRAPIAVARSSVRAVAELLPVLPAALRARGAEGLCKVLVDVGADGVPTRVETLACPPVFAGAVADAVIHSRFEPFLNAAGVSVAVRFEVGYRFEAAGVTRAP